MRAQHLAQDLAPAAGVRRQQHAPLEGAQELIKRCERLAGAHIQAQLARGGGREVVHRTRWAGELGVRLEGIERDGGERREAGRELLGVEEQFRRRQHRALEVVAAILVARADVLPGLVQRLRERRVMHDHRITRQVIEQRRRGVEEQRLVELHARRCQAFAHAAIDGGLGRVALEARAPAAAELAHGVGIERHLACRQQPYRVERIE